MRFRGNYGSAAALDLNVNLHHSLKQSSVFQALHRLVSFRLQELPGTDLGGAWTLFGLCRKAQGVKGASIGCGGRERFALDRPLKQTDFLN